MEHISEYTADDFICEMVFTPIDRLTAHMDIYTDTYVELKTELVKSYNPATGILSLTGGEIRAYVTYVYGVLNDVTLTSNVIVYLKVKTPI